MKIDWQTTYAGLVMESNVITKQNYMDALLSLIQKEKLTENHLKMFDFHFNSKDMKTTCRKIGHHLGYHGNGANGLIGSFSVMIADELEVIPTERRKADDSIMWFSVIHDGTKPKDDHFTFELRSEFASALEELGLVTRKV
ncbi:hypothetical protein VCR14J2_390390 [Vibrio coralliirubri]|uniref:hypothetical protein n=1 Tax=Vibrio coralliirubri TaxID=1516159 RepID=UPI0006351315|nr:hypothetical protein [Vibrio coralliirubri]CDU05800.1 hypothetical protein VCR14J2_390390 [Vibrio coralliirubri]